MKKFLLIVCAALMVFVFTAPVMAKTTVGGIVMTDVYWFDQDAAGASGGIDNRTAVANGTLQDGYQKFIIEVPGHSRFKVRWTNEDNIGMFVEMSLFATGGGQGVGLRHAYGWWDITPNFKFLAGHTSLPFSPLNPIQMVGTSCTDAQGNARSFIVGEGYGNFDANRAPQIRVEFKYPNNMGNFKFVLSNEYRGGALAYAAADAQVNNTVNEESVLPRIDLATNLYFGPVKIYPSFFWQQQNYETLEAGDDDNLDVWGLSLGLKFSAGPFTFSGEVNYGENWRNAQIGSAPNASPAMAFAIAEQYDTDGDGDVDAINDAQSLGWWVDLAFKFGITTIHGYVGSLNTDRDERPGSTNDVDITTWMYGVGAKIAAAKGFNITPEITFYDNDGSAQINDGTNDSYDYGDDLLIGVQFQIIF